MYRAFVPALLLLLAGCAYYNTFYNARESYNEALEYAREHPDDPAHHEKPLLDAAIQGAGRVLSRYSDSRWVDDAQLLLGDALLLRGKRTLVGSGTSDFEQAMMSYASAVVMTESRSIEDRALLGMGKAAMELGRYNDAVAAFSQISRDDDSRYTTGMLLLCEAYILSGQPGNALALHDTLTPAGGDSLEAEYFITGGRILTALGMPDSGAAVALKATGIETRGNVYYRALVTAAESYLEAGLPQYASGELNRLLQGYRSNREMADISLLKGRSDEMAGDTTAALTAYLDAAELDSYRETGAEALYRRALLLERGGRYDEALEALLDCASRPGDFMWLRLAENRHRDLDLYRAYTDSARVNSGDDEIKFLLLASEKRLDLYGADETALEGLQEVASSGHVLFAPMAEVLLAENGAVPADSVSTLYLGMIESIPESDLAGKLEEYLGLPPAAEASRRPSAVLERAWDLIEEQRFETAWEILDDLLDSPFGYEVRAEALWAAYVASEGARMDPGLVDSYLNSLTSEYPYTPQGIEAALRRAEGIGGYEDPEGGGDE